MSQDLLELFHSFFISVLGAHVHFSKDDEERDLKEETKTNVLLGHLLNTHISADYNAAEVRGEASETVDGGFEVFFVSAQVDE